jgi:small subunit ribosomal protein S2
LGSERKILLFVGGKPESHKAIREAAARARAPYVVGRWIGGMLTNFSEIKKRVAHMQDLTTRREAGTLSKYTKFERLQIDREIDKLESMFGGLLPLGDKLPHAMFVVDPKREAIAIREAKRNNIPVIALANSDCNMHIIDYPIPANDAAIKSIAWFVSEIATAYKEGLDGALSPASATAPKA